MLFSLDFNWDFDKVPVYWASEEISIHEYRFTCRDYTYKPNKKIQQILTGKTDKNGFSTRMINALKQINTKWVIYMQEDMWLISKIDSELLSNLNRFAQPKQS
jgi:CRISPR/Cas system Type II protein with McrA/HNH and RuvC-like nuclease domain